MGAWGHGIRQDDLVCDVIGAFEDHLKQGKSIADATAAVRTQFAEAIEDADDGPLFWIGLADAQWTYGQLKPSVLRHVKEDFRSGRSLSRWEENVRDLSRRRSVLEKFIKKIARPNPRRKELPRTVVRAPKFQPGDCLSVLLENGQYGAALVLAADHSDPEYGANLIGVLDYMSPDKPPPGFFKKRKWLRLTHHNWKNTLDLTWYLHVGFRKMKPRLEVIACVELLKSDPKPAKEGISYAGWEHLGQQVIWQREWGTHLSLWC